MHELNLLPPDRRRSLRRQATLVSLTYLMNSLVAAAGLLVVGSFLAWGGLWFMSTTASPTTASELLLVVSDYQKLRDDIARQNLFLTNLNTISQKRLVWSQVISAFLESVPPGADIATLKGNTLVKPDKSQSLSMTISGKAVARSTLTSFGDRLRALPFVSSVDAPTTNLLLRDNPSYTFTLHLKADATQDKK